MSGAAIRSPPGGSHAFVRCFAQHWIAAMRPKAQQPMRRTDSSRHERRHQRQRGIPSGRSRLAWARRIKSPSTATATTNSATTQTAAWPTRPSGRATRRSRSCAFCPASDTLSDWVDEQKALERGARQWGAKCWHACFAPSVTTVQGEDLRLSYSKIRATRPPPSRRSQLPGRDLAQGRRRNHHRRRHSQSVAAQRASHETPRRLHAENPNQLDRVHVLVNMTTHRVASLRSH